MIFFAGVVEEKDKVEQPEDGAAFATTFLVSDRRVCGTWLEEDSLVDFDLAESLSCLPLSGLLLSLFWMERSSGLSVSADSVVCFWSVDCSSLGHAVCVDSSDLCFMAMCLRRLSFLLAGYS